MSAGRGPDPIERLLGATRPADGGDSPTVASFLRGLTIGALVGAAIAGSALLGRRRAHREERPSAPAPEPEAPPADARRPDR